MKKLIEHWKGLMGHWWNPHFHWLVSGMVQGELVLYFSAVRYAMLVKHNSFGEKVWRSYCRPFVADCLTPGASYHPLVMSSVLPLPRPAAPALHRPTPYP